MGDFFRRVEKKYIITKQQYLRLKEKLEKYMIEDEHGKSTICNIYFDTEKFDLIRHSITKPIYKDKIRLRSYNVPNLESTVFLEVKRKYDSVVSKRRIQMTLKDFYNNIDNKFEEMEQTQITKELNYYFKYYNLKPTMYLSYFRRAYYDKENRDFRVTFDSNITARPYDLKLEKGVYGDLIFEENKYIMEIKTLGAIPMWLVKLLNELKIAPCGFSKYGEAYTQLILNANSISEYVV
ncbi:MAG: polyphosphate polymerase domain-containing protein [Clostridia bacterium]|nr:polyphosphate polymerase domain-containing protein [Clostridia bacterium]